MLVQEMKVRRSNPQTKRRVGMVADMISTGTLEMASDSRIGIEGS